MVARERSNPRKRALMLISGGGEGWWWPEKGPTTENERLCSFSGVCGWWLSWRGQPTRKRANERERSFSGAVVASERS